MKHLAGIELGYFGEAFGRVADDRPGWMDQYVERLETIARAAPA